MPVSKDQPTPKQRRFAQEYHVLHVSPDCSDPVTEAAKRAGYAEKSAYAQGSRLLRMDKIQAELARLGAEVAERHKIDQDFFVREFLENHQLARAGTPVMNRHNEPVMRDGEPLIKRDISGSNKALELLARVTGHFVEKHDVMNRRPSLDDMDETELAAERDKLKTEIARLKANDGNVVPLRAVGDDD